MKNMKKLTFKLACFFLSLLVSSVAMAESITSPNGLLKLNVSVNEKGEPVYELSYKGKEVIKPSKLGLELKDDPGLMDGFTLSDAKTSSFVVEIRSEIRVRHYTDENESPFCDPELSGLK